MAIILLYRSNIRKEKLRFDNAFYFLFAYGLFVVMSALFSPHKYWLVRGTYELFEPVWVVFAYILMCYYTYNYVDQMQKLAFVLKFAGIGVMIVTLIGLFQFFGMDFFCSGIGKHFITNVSVWGNLDNLSVGFLQNVSYI